MKSCTRRIAEVIQARSLKVVIVCILLCFITPIYGATPWLHVDGNKIKDPAGNAVVLRGVALVDLGHVELWRDGVTTMIDRLTDETDTQGVSPGWYTRIVRLAVYPSDQPDFDSPWFFDDNPDDYYNNLLRPVVDYCAMKGLYVIIDWHYIANTSDHVTSTSQFWDYISPRFAGDSHVLFELFNEPMDSSWSVVKADMQTWIDIVRSHAPNNLILVGGPQWCQILAPQINDPVVGDNIVYIAHLYPAHWYGGVWQINVDAIADCAAVHPVMMTEWGFSMSMGSSTLMNGTITEYGQPLMDFLELHGIGNTAWCADYLWGPPMYWPDWTLRCGEGEMGCFVKDTLYLRRNDNQPVDNSICVDADANGLNDGTNWENAYKYLQDALADAYSATKPVEIHVAEGIYTPDSSSAEPNGTGDREATFQLINGLYIKGGYAGFGQPDPNARDIKLYETILSGDLNGDDGPNFANNGENSYHVVTCIGRDETARLDGFTIIGGNANGSYPYNNGGGMFNNNSSPIVINSTFSGNYATLLGGGMCNRSNSSPSITNCTFCSNEAEWGGGMENGSSNPNIANCTFNENSATMSGGGIRNHNSSPNVFNCSFFANEAQFGGAIHNEDDGSQPIFTQCTFIGNTAANFGGAIRNHTSSPTILNSLIIGNQAEYGGGIYNENDMSNPTLINCTITSNSATGWGGGICLNASNPTVTNCILWSNVPDEISYGTAVVTYSNVQGGWPGEGNINADPMFVAADSNDFHLPLGSPCIDTGDNAAVPAGVTTDLDGNPRIRGPAVDMGVYESPAVLFVDVDAAGANNGSSWEDAYNHLQDALSVEWLVDEIRVAEGIYKPDEDTAHPNGSGDRAATFQLRTGVAIKGGYAGYGEPDPDARDIGVYETTLSGDLNGNDGPDFANNGENSFHVVTDIETNETAVLDGFTITAGNANGPDENIQDMGGGMLNLQSKSTLTNCTFIANSADYAGGLFSYYNSNPTLTHCTFINNWAGEIGGGMVSFYNCNSTLTNCTFSENSTGYIGGGMINYDNCNPTLINCTFSANSALQGSGMFNYYNSSPTVANCTFNGNLAETGGGMLNYDNSNPTLNNCSFSGNSASTGGGMYNEISSPTLASCTFNGNPADVGGGMANYESSPTLTSCMFSGNLAEVGGGMFSYYNCNPTLDNCTFSNNSAGSFGGGISNWENSSPTVSNCILWGNIASYGAQIYNDGGSLTTVSYSDVQGGWPGEGNIDAGPCLVDPDSNDYHLLPDSPCINTGDPNYVPDPNETDIDGELRVMLGRVDMGADEFNPFEIDVIVVNKRRVGRTIFEYDCNAYLHNISLFDIENIQLEIIKTPENMRIIDPNVTFGGVVVIAGQSATSVDTCTFEVDRAQAIEPAEIIWWSRCDLAATGQQMQHSGSSIILLEEDNTAGDLTGDGEVNFEDLAKLCLYWLQDEASVDIAPPGGDGIVNFLDFAKLAENWGQL